MARYPRGARRPRKPWKGKPGLPSVVGNVSFSGMLGNPETAGASYTQRNAYKNEQNPTKAESQFKDLLKSIKVRFQTQYTLSGKHILDYYLFDSKIAVEVDGSYHNSPAQKKKDKLKEMECKRNGIALLRYSNQDVLRHSDDVKEDLIKNIRSRGGGMIRVARSQPEKRQGINTRGLFVNYDEAFSHLKKYGGVLRPCNGGWRIDRR